MMTPALFTLQIVLLALGFGVGYLLLINSRTQENNLRKLGEALGWTLIAATIVLEILNFYYSATIVNDYVQKIYVPFSPDNTTQQPYIPQPGVSEVSPSEEKSMNNNHNDSTSVEP